MPGDSDLAGYRIVRRIATGDRATVYLATAHAAPASAKSGSVVGSSFAPPPMAGDAAAPVALRLYDPDADATAITIELEALAADGGRTLPAPIDVASLPDGRVCVVVERIAGERLSMLLDECSLSPGQAVTVLAPLAAAVRRLAETGFVHTRLSPSDVLFDATGRPRLLGLGALVRLDGRSAVERSALLRDGHEALGRLVDSVAASVRPPTTFARAGELVAAGLAARPFTPFALELERVLFDIAAPEPVIERRALGGASRIVPPPVAIAQDPVGRIAEEPAASTGSTPRGDAPHEMLAQEAPLIAAFRSTRVAAALRRTIGRRRAPLLVGALGGGAVLVLLLAAVPPGSGHDGAVAVDGIAASAGRDASAVRSGTGADGGAADAAGAAAASGALGDTGTPAEEQLAEADPAVVAAELMELRESCFSTADGECLGAVVQPGSALEAEDAAALAAGIDHRAERPEFDLGAITVQGEMGQAVLLRVPYHDAERQPASLLMVRSEAGWRLRELFD
ncbi:hypothetical protein ACWKWP_03975 [Agromyces soli]